MTGPQQLALIAPPPFAPSWPSPTGMASAALHLMLGGAKIDHHDFMGELHSHRLAAYVYDLRALGWPVDTILVPAPSADCPGRTIARYSLPEWVRQAVGQRGQP